MADPTQGNPPKPGDPVPDGGLDPTQVFGSPPPPKPASAGAGTTGDDGAAPAQDKSPPPPPVGTAATKEAGYDDEDIRMMVSIKLAPAIKAIMDELTAAKPPATPTD